MNDIIRADIFFFVTTVSVAVLSIFLLIALIYVLRILSDVRHITGKAKIESEFIIEEVRRTRERMARSRLPWLGIFAFARRLFSRYRSRPRRWMSDY